MWPCNNDVVSTCGKSPKDFSPRGVMYFLSKFDDCAPCIQLSIQRFAWPHKSHDHTIRASPAPEYWGLVDSSQKAAPAARI